LTVHRPPAHSTGSGIDKRPAVPSRLPTREELRAARVAVLHRGGADKADLLLLDIDGEPVVVKDFAGKSWGTRLLGRLQIRRECRAYRWIGRVPGVPALIGRIDPHALVLEKVDGEQLAVFVGRTDDGRNLVKRLRSVIDRIHAAGVIHNDLACRENVIVRPDGDLVLIDLAGALCLRPGGLAHRLLFRWLALVDEAAFLKWKRLLAPDDLTPGERRFLARFAKVRWLWPFNRKGRAAESGSR
jgi:serine/threonine protein kinase